MTPEEFSATKLWVSNCHNMATYTPLSLRPDELPTVADSVARWNPTNIDYDEWFDWVVRIGGQGVMPITSHWDGFCIWPSQTSARNVTASPWWDLYGERDPLAEFYRHARIRGLRMGIYYCVRDGFYESAPVGTYTDWTINKLTELLDGTYGEIDFLFLDGWGDFWAAGSGVGYDEVDYDTVMAAVAALSDCVIAVNDHEQVGPDVHGNVSLWERQVDGVPPAGFDVFPAVCLHDTIHTNSMWFRHADSAADTKTGAVVPLGRKYLMRKRGYVDLINFSTDLDGTVGADTRLLLAGMTTRELPIAIAENFSLTASETAPITLQTRTDWTKNFGGAVNVSINPSGEAFTTSTGAGYHRTDVSFADGRVRLKLKFLSVPTNFSAGVQLRSNGTTTNDDRWVLGKTGSTITLTLSANNSGLTTLDSALFDETLVVGQEYWLDIEKVGSEVIGTFWVEVDGEMEIWARRVATSATNSAAGFAGFFLVDSTGSATAGVHVTEFDAYLNDTTAPISPTLSVATDETNGNHLAIRTFGATIYTKIYRSDDGGETYELAGFTSDNSFVDSELGTGTAMYKAKGIDPSWNESAFGNIVLLTGTVGIKPVADAINSKIGTPAGGSVSEDIAAIEAGGGSTTDFDDDPVPPSRTWKLKQSNVSTEGLVGEDVKTLSVGEPLMFAVDYAVDLSTNGQIQTFHTPTIVSGPEGGVTFGTLGREDSQGKVAITAVTPGTYAIKFKATYKSGGTRPAICTLKVPN